MLWLADIFGRSAQGVNSLTSTIQTEMFTAPLFTIPQSICTWFLKSLVHEIDFWTWFFIYFKLDFYYQSSLQKSSLK